MCLRPEYFLFASLQMVPLRCPAAGQAIGNGVAVPGGIKTLRGLRPIIPSRFQPGEILQALCKENPPRTENSQRQEKAAPMRTIRSKKALRLLAFQAAINGYEG